MSKQRKTAGFTLIELMIAVAIIGILTAVALPAYKNYVIRSRLVAGTNALATMRAQMEQYYLDNRTYMTVSSPSIVTPCTQYAVTTTTSQMPFTVGCSASGDVPTATTYTLRASGVGVVAGAVYTVDQANNMVTVSYPTTWGTVPSNSCWLMRKGDTC